MLRFIDLTEAYWTDPSVGTPVCAFLSTSDDRFICNENGQDIFFCLDDFHGMARATVKRCLGLVPDGFWEGKLAGDVKFIPLGNSKCSFLIGEVYVAKLDGSQVFDRVEDVIGHPIGSKMFAVLPEGYLEG